MNVSDSLQHFTNNKIIIIMRIVVGVAISSSGRKVGDESRHVHTISTPVSIILVAVTEMLINLL